MCMVPWLSVIDIKWSIVTILAALYTRWEEQCPRDCDVAVLWWIVEDCKSFYMEQEKRRFIAVGASVCSFRNFIDILRKFDRICMGMF